MLTENSKRPLFFLGKKSLQLHTQLHHSFRKISVSFLSTLSNLINALKKGKKLQRLRGHDRFQLLKKKSEENHFLKRKQSNKARERTIHLHGYFSIPFFFQTSIFQVSNVTIWQKHDKGILLWINVVHRSTRTLKIFQYFWMLNGVKRNNGRQICAIQFVEIIELLSKALSSFYCPRGVKGTNFWTDNHFLE